MPEGADEMAKITVTLLDDTGSSPTDNVSMFDTLTGTGTPGATITFTLGGVSIGTTTADISGAWTFTPVGLANGNYKVTVSEPGASTWISFTLDTVAPAVTGGSRQGHRGVGDRQHHVQSGAVEQNQRGNATGHVRDLARLVRRERAAQQIKFPIRQPLLDDLITANGVSPDFFRHVAPASGLRSGKCRAWRSQGRARRSVRAVPRQPGRSRCQWRRAEDCPPYLPPLLPP